jgi:beta-glucosidase
VLYAEGCSILGTHSKWGDRSTQGFSEAEAAADRADVVILALGLTAEYEGEEGSAQHSEAGGDRTRIDLPAVQQQLLERIVGRGKPVVLVLFSGSALSVGWAHEHVASIVQAWYPGGEGGRAIADVLFGACSPAGRLPVTVVRSLDQLPPFEDYSMVGRTYRYMNAEPLYPFGFGLSYTRFDYFGLRVDTPVVAANGEVRLSFAVRNTGSRAGKEVAQVYVRDQVSSTTTPVMRLVAFAKPELAPGEARRLPFAVPAAALALWDARMQRVVEPGGFDLMVGASAEDIRLRSSFLVA